MPDAAFGAADGDGERSSASATVHRLTRPGLYLLKIEAATGELPFTVLELDLADGMRTVHIPASGTVNYLLTIGPEGIAFSLPQARILELRPLRMLDWIRLAGNSRQRDQFPLPLVDRATIRPLLRGSGSENRQLARILRNLAGWGLDPASPTLQAALSHHGRAGPRTQPMQITTHGYRIAIVLHLHYLELWPEFEVLLNAIAQPFDLVITVTSLQSAFEAQVRTSFPQARILCYGNAGRDIAPFLQLLREGHLDPYDLVCKLHGKRSPETGKRAVLGTLWRWILMRDLAGSTAVVQAILDRFARDATVGEIGPRSFRLPNRFKDDQAALGDNDTILFDLAERIGISRDAMKLDYFAGTMFWIRREVLQVIKGLDLSLSDFGAEKGRIDGALEHGLERLFGLAPQAAKLHLEDTEADDGPSSAIRLG